MQEVGFCCGTKCSQHGAECLLSVVAWEHHRVFAIYSCLGTPNMGFGEVANDAALCAHAEIYLRIAVMICVVAAPLHEL